MNNSYSWNDYVIRIGGLVVILSWIYLVLFIRGVISNNSFSIIAIFVLLIGTPLVIGYWFVDMRNRKLKKAAKDFGLSFEKLIPSSSLEEFLINRITGKINGSDIVIEDHQKLHWVPLGGPMGGHIASRRTVFFINQIEQKTPSSWNGYMSINGIRKQLMSIEDEKKEGM